MPNLSLFIDTYSANHRNRKNHPESPERILRLADMVESYQGNADVAIHHLDRIRTVDPTLVHQSDYLEYLKKNVPPDGQYFQLDEDTGANSESLNVALAGLKMMQQGIDSTIQNNSYTFVMTRPPGHHARPSTSMGFCIFNNVAYAAEYARKKFGIRKIAIFDWDVHHFNGTEEMFYTDADTLTISTHQFPHWPEGYGWVDRRGKDAGQNMNINLPLPHQAGDVQIMQYFEEYILPQMQAFQPELILISAGFDAHKDERNSTLGVPSVLALSEYGYSWMTNQLQIFAKKNCHNRLMFVLEGGYYLPSLVSSVQAVIQTLLNQKTVSEYTPTQGENMDQKTWTEYLHAIQSYCTIPTVS